MDVKKSRPRCERPRGSHTAKRRDERAPLSLPDASRAFDGKNSTSRYGTRLLRCGISIQPMSQMGHVWTAPPWQELSGVFAALVGCGHVSGLFVRR